MTIAIYVRCGAQKFGAFVRCGRCGYEPQTVAEKSKSIMLSDHNFPPEELRKFQATIESGGEIPYDSVSLASLARPLLEEAYFWNSFDNDKQALPCKRCGKTFSPEHENVYCSACCSELEQPLSSCSSCHLLFEYGARFCQKCGMSLSQDSSVTTQSIGTNLALFVRRAVKNENFLARSQYITEFRKHMSVRERLASDFEFEILGMYLGMLTLSKHLGFKEALVKCVREMVDLYRESFMLDGADAQSASARASLCMRRFDQYDNTLAAQPDRWMLFLSNEAGKNCIGVEGHLGVATEMAIVIGYFSKVFEGSLQAIVFRS